MRLTVTDQFGARRDDDQLHASTGSTNTAPTVTANGGPAFVDVRARGGVPLTGTATDPQTTRPRRRP